MLRWFLRLVGVAVSGECPGAEAILHSELSEEDPFESDGARDPDDYDIDPEDDHLPEHPDEW